MTRIIFHHFLGHAGTAVVRSPDALTSGMMQKYSASEFCGLRKKQVRRSNDINQQTKNEFFHGNSPLLMRSNFCCNIGRLFIFVNKKIPRPIKIAGQEGATKSKHQVTKSKFQTCPIRTWQLASS